MTILELGQHPTEEEILKMINEVDQNNKGCLGISFLLAVQKYNYDNNKTTTILKGQ